MLLIRFLLVTAILFLPGCHETKTSRLEFPKTTESLSAFERDGEDMIYALRRPPSPWGDYGNMLFHGMTMRLGRTSEPDGELQLERAGPAIPAITFPAEGILVTDHLKIRMQDAGFVGVAFRKVELARIVKLDWETWDLAANDPRYYPDGGSPALYILNLEHSDAAAEQMGPIWELVITQNAKLRRIETDDDLSFEYILGTWQGNDMFRTSKNGLAYVSPRAMRWFREYFEDWVKFQDGKYHSMSTE